MTIGPVDSSLENCSELGCYHWNKDDVRLDFDSQRKLISCYLLFPNILAVPNYDFWSSLPNSIDAFWSVHPVETHRSFLKTAVCYLLSQRPGKMFRRIYFNAVRIPRIEFFQGEESWETPLWINFTRMVRDHQLLKGVTVLQLLLKIGNLSYKYWTSHVNLASNSGCQIRQSMLASYNCIFHCLQTSFGWSRHF